VDYFINWSLLKHPVNYFTVTLMILIAAIALHFILQYQTSPSNPLNPNPAAQQNNS
jgi:hypothetical protein